MNRRPGRWLRATATGIAALYAIYVGVGNALLNSNYGRALANRTPEKAAASWGAAWTVLPGQVHAREVRLAGHVRHVVWSVQADSVRVRLALLPLLRRELRVPSVVATGVSGGATRVNVERLPPAPRPGGWTIRFDRIVAESARHAYFNSVVLQGNGHASGGFAKTLRGGPMEVLPSVIHFDEGVIFRDGARLAWDSRIESSLAIARHLRQDAPGIRKLEKTDLDVEIEARTAGLLLLHGTGLKPELRLSSGPGRLSGRIGWHQGTLVPGRSLSLAFPAAGELAGTVESTQAVVGVRITDDAIHINGELAPINSGSISAAADLVIQGRDVPVPNIGLLAKRASGQLVGRWHFESLAWLAELLPGPRIVSFNGAGTARTDLKFHDGQLDAGSFVEVPQVSARATALGNSFDGDARARVTFETTLPGELQPHLVAEMPDFRISPADSPNEPYVYGQGLQIEATTHGDRSTLDDRIHARIRFKDARVPDLRSYNRYLPNSKLRFRGGKGRVSGDLRFDREGNVAHGSLLVDGERVQLALADLLLQGDVLVDTRLRRANLAAGQFDAGGSRVSLKGILVSSDEEVLDSDWWAQVSLDQARMDWGKPATIDGKISAQLKDASVLLAVYAHRKHLPDWVEKVIDAGEVNAEGHVRVHQGTLLLDPFNARNDRFEVLSRLSLHDKQATGDLLAHWGSLSMGIELVNGKRQIHLIGARKWYDGQPGLANR
jgi:hypothetical protein